MHEQPSTRRLEPVELYFQYRNCDRWAVIVGISEYGHPAWNLNYAHRDAEEFYNLLLTPKGGGFKKEHIRKLTNKDATTVSITGALRTFLQKPARDDLVIIYFACHGAPDYNRLRNVYLLTYDTDPSDIAGTALPMREIDLSLKENLHAEKVIILADTCHSAAIGGGIGRRSVDDAELVNHYVRELSLARGGIALLTSAEASEVSFEDAKWGEGHGVFTHYLLEGMRGAADRDGNGIVTVGELFDYVQENVKHETNHKQHPCIGTNAYDRNLPVAIVAPKAKMTSSEEQHSLLFKQLLTMDFKQQVRSFNQVIDSSQTAAFLVHGESLGGQELLLTRLIRQKREWKNISPIKINVTRHGVCDKTPLLWQHLAPSVGLLRNAESKEIIDRICDRLLTQDVIFIFYSVEHMRPEVLMEWIQDFWVSLVAKLELNPRPNKGDKHLLMFLVDTGGRSGESNIMLAKQPDQSDDPRIPVNLPPVSPFTHDVLDEWIQYVNLTVDEWMPAGLTSQILLERSENGLPQLVYEEICFHCGYSWEGVAKWLI